LKKLYYLFFFIFSIVNLIAQDSLLNKQKYYKNDVSYNRSGIYYNGFRLKHKETTYTNSYIFLNSFGVGIKNNFELNIANLIVPFSNESNSNFTPSVLLIIPKVGYDFGLYHHISVSCIFGPFSNVTFSNKFINKQIAYTFGTPKNNIGILFSNDDIVKTKTNFLYLQSSFYVSKWLKIGAEHVLYTNYDQVNNSNNIDINYSFKQKTKLEYLIPTNLTFRINVRNKATFCIGSVMDYLNVKRQLYLSCSVRLNNRKK
jgi:hypothetical protein